VSGACVGHGLRGIKAVEVVYCDVGAVGGESCGEEGAETAGRRTGLGLDGRKGLGGYMRGGDRRGEERVRR
jgi:hypothetical protein